MRVRDIIEKEGRSFSFEFFPPKTAEAEEALFDVIVNELAPLRPTFVSVTYGAGGSTRDRTLRLVARIARETDLTPVAHLTTVLADRDELGRTVDALAESGVENILALRGDPPPGVPEGQTIHHSGLEHAIELVRLIHERAPGRFSVGVAAHPEGHPQSTNLEDDARFLVEKVRAGADFVVTQFFFEAAHYFALRERAIRHGLPPSVPILPGIMPVTNAGQIKRFAELSGADFPAWLAERLEAAQDAADVRAIGVEVATTLCEELLAGGAPGLHFYTLNRSTATREIYRNLGLAPRGSAPA
jgi:methylenetetrahydrofolate reductase (NADPH)